MNKSIKGLSMIMASIGLCSCMNDNQSGVLNYYTMYDNTPFYTQQYDETYYYDYQPRAKKPVVVPESYHVGAFHSPTSHVDRDKQWVNEQNPSAYTIEVASDSKAAAVAQTLFKTPKNQRMAEVKGSAGYKGVYGSFDNLDAAQKALQSLPADVKARAKIKQWQHVQQGVE